MRAAKTGPTPGSPSSSVKLARFKLTFPPLAPLDAEETPRSKLAALSIYIC